MPFRSADYDYVLYADDEIYYSQSSRLNMDCPFYEDAMVVVRFSQIESDMVDTMNSLEIITSIYKEDSVRECHLIIVDDLILLIKISFYSFVAPFSYPYQTNKKDLAIALGEDNTDLLCGLFKALLK